MLLKRAKQLIAIIICWSLIYTPVFAQGQLALPANDFDAPKITHEPLNETFKSGTVKPITATVTDDVAVKSVVLYYRQLGTERFQQANFQRVGNTDEYRVELDELYYQPPGIEYYIQAIDTAGNGLLVGSSFSPLTIAFGDGGVAPPVGESKSPSGSQTVELSLNDKKEESSYKWLWIGLGVLAVGALASGGSGGGGDDPDQGKTGTVVISGDTP